MGMQPAMVVHAAAMGPAHTFCVVYGSVTHLIDLEAVEVVERDYPLLSPRDVNVAIKEGIQRPLVVVGACIGTDAHTVGIDAILNIKGFAGDKGLEYYSEMVVMNLGAQVLVPSSSSAPRTAESRRRPGQPGRHSARCPPAQHPRRCPLRSARPTPRAASHCGGRGATVRCSDAGELGVDRIFARGTTPGDVASYLVHAMKAKMNA